ncbi:hypothetical protein JCM11641_003577 [Rhodosporidiobolus odoratus]
MQLFLDAFLLALNANVIPPITFESALSYLVIVSSAVYTAYRFAVLVSPVVLVTGICTVIHFDLLRVAPGHRRAQVRPSAVRPNYVQGDNVSLLFYIYWALREAAKLGRLVFAYEPSSVEVWDQAALDGAFGNAADSSDFWQTIGCDDPATRLFSPTRLVIVEGLAHLLDTYFARRRALVPNGGSPI